MLAKHDADTVFTTGDVRARMADDPVTVERTDGVGRVVMDRPERNNSINRAMADDLRDAAIDLMEDDAVRAIVVTGSGGTFNTGADLSTLEGDESDGARLRQLATQLHAAVEHLAGGPKPVVSGINGVVAGGGIGLAVGMDIVIMSEEARIEFAYPRIGVSGDGGSTYYLPRLVGLRRALDIALLDKAIPAGEAVDLGLASEAVPADEFDDRVAEVATELAAGPTLAHAATKALLRESLDRGHGAQLAAEAESIAALTDTEDYARGIEAFFEKEQAEFTGE